MQKTSSIPDESQKYWLYPALRLIRTAQDMHRCYDLYLRYLKIRSILDHRSVRTKNHKIPKLAHCAEQNLQLAVSTFAQRYDMPTEVKREWSRFLLYKRKRRIDGSNGRATYCLKARIAHRRMVPIAFQQSLNSLLMSHSPVSIANRARLHPSSVRCYKRGDRMPKQRNLRKILTATGASRRISMDMLRTYGT